MGYLASFYLAIAATGVLAFTDSSIRTVKFLHSHTESLPLSAIESLRYAAPLPRPLDAAGYTAARASIANTSVTPVEISDFAIDILQGRFERKLWGAGYIDVTETQQPLLKASKVVPAPAAVTAPAYPTVNPSAHPELTAMLALVTAAEIKSYVNTLSTTFATRYYKSSIARKSATWIQTQMTSWLGASQVSLVENTFDQPNVIGRIEAKSGGASAGIVILGAHLDSTSQSASSLAPGADDDATGTAVILAALRILKATNYTGTYAIEVHAYAGEEGGLLGSVKVAAAYKSAGKKIRGMLDLEMVGWHPSTSSSSGKSSTITVLSDPVTGMSTHMTNVVKAYVPTAERRLVSCGYGCSDHYSFYDQGYPVVCISAYGPNDANLNPYYHSTGDTIDKLNFDKAADFVKATLAWVVEVAA